MSTPTNAPEPADKPRYFYITAREGSRYAIVAGPFSSHGDAEPHVAAARHLAIRRFTDAAFAGFGVAASPTYRIPRPGRCLNTELGVTPCPKGF